MVFVAPSSLASFSRLGIRSTCALLSQGDDIERERKKAHRKDVLDAHRSGSEESAKADGAETEDGDRGLLVGLGDAQHRSSAGLEATAERTGEFDVGLGRYDDDLLGLHDSSEAGTKGRTDVLCMIACFAKPDWPKKAPLIERPWSSLPTA